MVDEIKVPHPELNIRILKFYEKVVPKMGWRGGIPSNDVKNWIETGENEVIDMVSWCPAGQADRSVVNVSIQSLSRVHRSGVAEDNPAVVQARMLWDRIRPAYELWKKGEEIPIDGTPLAIANFLRAEDTEVLKRNGVRTLEELISMPESSRDKIPLPSIREKVAQAKRFLAAQDQNKVAAQIKARDDEVAVLKQQMAEMQAKLDAVPRSETQPVKRGPGRPPKQPEQAEETA